MWITTAKMWIALGNADCEWKHGLAMTVWIASDYWIEPENYESQIQPISIPIHTSQTLHDGTQAPLYGESSQEKPEAIQPLLHSAPDAHPPPGRPSYATPTPKT